jgi:hypothetical protein
MMNWDNRGCGLAPRSAKRTPTRGPAPRECTSLSCAREGFSGRASREVSGE